MTRGATQAGGTRAAPRDLLVLSLYAATLCLSAALMFWVQPMFAKMVLPLLGGAPSVWNVAMVFFQATLLAGYGYAHLVARGLPPRAQAAAHVLVLAAAAAVLPLSVPAGSAPPPAGGSPGLWLAALLAATVGPPFFALAATAPLLQHWFSRTRHPAARDPYFLYSASNAGSLLGLLAYPLLLEPLLGTGRQSLLWAAGFVALAAAIVGCAVARWRLRAGDAPPADAGPSSVEPAAGAVGSGDRLRWVLLGLVPSSLLLGVTTHVTTDLAAVPLLWVVPLALYLLSFIVAFARRPALRHAWMVAAQPFLVVAVAVAPQEDRPVWSLGLHLLTFFVTAMVCHGELARRRPDAGRLTEFYLLVSLGGVLGGAFNALAAPVVFDAAHEYPLALVAACLLRPSAAAPAPGQRRLDLLLPALLAALLLAFSWADPLVSDRLPPPVALFAFVAVVATFLLAACGARPVRFGLGVAAVLALSPYRADPQDVLHAERSFFGIYRVGATPDGSAVELHHGTTLHGAQYTDPGRWREPLTYYHRAGPFGEFFAARPARGGERVAVAGLGTGALACYALPGQDWTFYEIDPAMARLARDDRYFRYLSECGPSARVVLGDARLSLAEAPDASLDVLVLDAFSSDAIPVHLLTREAVRLYLRKVAADGVVVFHVSNRYFALAPLLGGLAAEEGLAARHREFWPDKEAEGEEEAEWAEAVELVVVARRDPALAFLDGVGGWQPLAAPAPAPTVWTDEYSDILGVLRWRD